MLVADNLLLVCETYIGIESEEEVIFMFTEESLQENRLRDYEKLAKIRGKLDFATKKNLIIYYSLSLVGMCDNVSGAVAKFNKFCNNVLHINPYKDNQALYSKKEMIFMIENKINKPLATKFIIQNLKITEEEQQSLKILIGPNEVQRRAEERLKKKYKISDNNTDTTTDTTEDDKDDEYNGYNLDEFLEKNCRIDEKTDEMFEGNPFDDTDDLPF